MSEEADIEEMVDEEEVEESPEDLDHLEVDTDEDGNVYLRNTRLEDGTVWLTITKGEKEEEDNGKEISREKYDHDTYVKADPGDVRMKFEIKPSDYFFEKERGKPALPGGGLDLYDKNWQVNGTREAEEEEEKPSAQKIIQKAIVSSSEPDMIIKEPLPNGKSSLTYVRVVKLSKDKFDIVASSKHTDDAGKAVIYSLEKVVTLHPKDFTFTHGYGLFSYLPQALPEEYHEAISRANKGN